MKKKITFYELLTMMKNGTAPDRVIYDGEAYYKNDCGYSRGRCDLSRSFSLMFSMFGMIEEEKIEYDDNILTEKEKAYLSAVLKPFKNHTLTITKEDATDGYNIIVMAGDEESQYYYFPMFPYESGMYKGMEVDKKYTPSELGLWDED